MIRPLRRAHRLIFVFLAILLPILIAIAFAARQSSDPPNPLLLQAPVPR